jgi:hypothetical protein
VFLAYIQFPGDYEDKEGTRKLDKTSSCGCCYGLDFLRDENVKLEIIHKNDDACRSADELVRDLPKVLLMLFLMLLLLIRCLIQLELGLVGELGAGRPACYRDQNGNEPCTVLVYVVQQERYRRV